MKQPIFHREAYLRKLRPFYRSDLIKVITGIRRCGKSCLLLSVMEELRREGVPAENIVYVNLDKRGFKNIRRPEQLEEAVASRLPAKADQVYLFVDEVQNVEDFEPVLNAFREEGVSIFVTGSNSYLLGGELATKLTGRHVEFDLFPLSFREWLDMRAFLGKPSVADRNAAFAEYVRSGGLPKTLEFDDPEARETYVESVVEQILHKDVRRRFKIRNRPVFDKVRTYLVNNFGAPTSLPNLEEEFRKRQGLPVTQRTLRRYLDILEKARILYPCPRFDLKSRKSLRGGGKLYLADTGLYFAANTDHRINYGPVLENLVFAHLRSEGFRVSVGRIGGLECDFIVRRREDYAYVQVAMTIADPETEAREFAPFAKIRDNYPKILLTLDPLLQRRDGIRHLNLLDVLTGRETLFP
ncbi:MAG: ATP-binding protein [Kiritimatiellae bacterium]|nr:ATP-binding protein [Kiritimatiellia bacterium]